MKLLIAALLLSGCSTFCPVEIAEDIGELVEDLGVGSAHSHEEKRGRH